MNEKNWIPVEEKNSRNVIFLSRFIHYFLIPLVMQDITFQFLRFIRRLLNVMIFLSYQMIDDYSWRSDEGNTLRRTNVNSFFFPGDRWVFASPATSVNLVSASEAIGASPAYISAQHLWFGYDPTFNQILGSGKNLYF